MRSGIKTDENLRQLSELVEAAANDADAPVEETAEAETNEDAA